MKREKLLVFGALALIFGIIACGGNRKTKSPFGEFFLVPPDVTTVDGANPYDTSETPPMADIYYDNTISQASYVKGGIFTQFYRATCSLSSGSNYKPQYWILKPNSSNFLRWTKIDKGEFNPANRSFYVSQGTFENKEVGPLTMIYNSDLINHENLSIVITDLEEQGLNMSLLADVIRNKLLKIENYAAAIIAVKVPFDGINYRPDPQNINKMSGAYYKGLKPLYAIVSGSKDAVRLFMRRFDEQTRDYSGFEYEKLTVQMDKINPLGISDLKVPETATRVEVKKLNDIWAKTIEDKAKIKRGGCQVTDRIWNLLNVTDAMVNHLGLSLDEELKPIVKELNTMLFKYETLVNSSPENIWRVNINFELPKGCRFEHLSTQVKNYRYLKLPNNSTDAKNAVWAKNELFINRDLDLVQPILLSGDGEKQTVQFGVLPKNRNGKLESQVVCFDLIVQTKKAVELETWVDDFDSADFGEPTANQDRTLNFKNFVRNLLKGESASGTIYSTDELIKVPIILFNLP